MDGGPMLDPTPQKKRGRPQLADVETSAIGNEEELPLSVHTVISDDDLLNEILVRLPVLSLVLFKSVSKRWLSLLKDDAFIKRRSRIPIIDPPSGLFFVRDQRINVYGFAPLDIRIRPRLENAFKPEFGGGHNATFLQSCNGLFLCSVKPGRKYCVYNPTINMFKMLPQPLYHEKPRHSFISMAFDPTKSLHYKVVYATDIGDDYLTLSYQIQTYSSETGIWSIICSRSDPWEAVRFQFEIYWNDAIHWLGGGYGDNVHYKLDLVNKTGVLTIIQLPVTMYNYCELYESRGCLLLLGMDETHSDQLNVYEMRNGDSEWSFKYSVNHSRIRIGGVKCIALGEREEDSFTVISLDGPNVEVVLYKFVAKTFRGLPEWQLVLPEYKYDSIDSFLFTASFASV